MLHLGIGPVSMSPVLLQCQGCEPGSTNGRTLHSSPVVFLDFRRGLLWNAASFLCSIRETSRFGVSL
jgi:hypothetical protein